MTRKLNITDLDAETRKKFNLRKPKQRAFSVEDERRFAIKALAVLSELKQSERLRVLERAIKQNKQ